VPALSGIRKWRKRYRRAQVLDADKAGTGILLDLDAKSLGASPAWRRGRS